MSDSMSKELAQQIDEKLSGMLSRAEKDLLEISLTLSAAADASIYRALGFRSMENWIEDRGLSRRTAFRYIKIGRWLTNDLPEDLSSRALKLGYSKIAVLAQCPESVVPSWLGAEGKQLIELAEKLTIADLESEIKARKPEKEKPAWESIRISVPADEVEEFMTAAAAGIKVEGINVKDVGQDAALGMVILCALRAASVEWQAQMGAARSDGRG